MKISVSLKYEQTAQRNTVTLNLEVAGKEQLLLK